MAIYNVRLRLYISLCVQCFSGYYLKNIKIPFIFFSKHIYDITFMTAEFSTNIENALKKWY